MTRAPIRRRAAAWRAVGLLLCAGWIAGCDEVNPLYCDARTPCPLPDYVCSYPISRCLPPGTDLGVARDLGLIDDHPDMSSPLACRSSDSCPASAPTCDGRRCTACRPADGGTANECLAYHAKTPFCSNGGGCVECFSAEHCGGQQKACDPQKMVCGACAAHVDCATGVCFDDGRCAPASAVLFVDNQGRPAADCRAGGGTHDGLSPATALCDVGEAVAALGARRYVILAASGQPYGGIRLDAGEVTVIAPNRIKASLQGPPGEPAVVLNGGSLVLDGVDVSGAGAAMMGVPAADCRGGGAPPSLTLRRARVTDSAGPAVRSRDCRLELDAVLVTGNVAGLVVEDGTRYTVVNSFIVGNGGAGAVLQPAATGTFAFNTVAANGALAGVAAGVLCRGGQHVESSLIAGNGFAGGTQLEDCRLVDVVTGTDAAPGANQALPRFQPCLSALAPTVTFCQTPGSPGIDLLPGAAFSDGGGTIVDGGARALVARDYFGAPRPLAGGWDVGAQEQ